MTQLSASSQWVWGVNSSSAVFIRPGGSAWNTSDWELVPGVSFSQVAVSDQHVWGLNLTGTVLHRKQGGGTWTPFLGKHFSQIASAGKHVYGVELNTSKIYQAHYSTAQRKPGEVWKQLYGQAAFVASMIDQVKVLS